MEAPKFWADEWFGDARGRDSGHRDGAIVGFRDERHRIRVQMIACGSAG